MKDVTPSSSFRLSVDCFLGFDFDFGCSQQSCDGMAWQLAPASTVVSSADSAPMAPVAQPNRHPPAIQIETLTERSNRTALFEKNRLISP